MIQVREMRWRDIPAVVRLAEEHHASSRYSDMLFSADAAARFCEVCLRERNYYAVLLIDAGAFIRGYAAVCLEPLQYANAFQGSEKAMYITPDARSMPAFRAMVQALEQWCKAQGACKIDMNMASPREKDEVLRYGKLYERAGYKFHSAAYTKELRDG